MVYQCNRLPNLVFPRITQIARIKFLAMEAILVSGSVHLRLFSCRFVHLAGSKCVGTSLVLGMKQRINQPSCVDGWPQTATPDSPTTIITSSLFRMISTPSGGTTKPRSQTFCSMPLQKPFKNFSAIPNILAVESACSVRCTLGTKRCKNTSTCTFSSPPVGCGRMVAGDN